MMERFKLREGCASCEVGKRKFAFFAESSV